MVSFLLVVLFVCGIESVCRADQIDTWRTYVESHAQKVLSYPLFDLKDFKVKVKLPKELLYPWDLNLLIVDSEDNPAFLPRMFTRKSHEVVRVPPRVLAEYLGVEESVVPYVRYLDHSTGYTVGFAHGGALSSHSRVLAVQIDNDYFSVRQQGIRGSGFSWSTPSWLYGTIALGLETSSSRFHYAHGFSPHWYLGIGILADSPNYLSVGSGRGGLLAGSTETSGQDVGLLYDSCHGLRVGLRWGRQVQRGNLFLSSRAITDTKLYGFIRNALSFAETEVDLLGDPKNVDVWFTSLQGEFGRQIDRNVSDLALRDRYHTQFNDWVGREREQGFTTIAHAQREARNQLSRLENELNKVVKPYTFNISSELQAMTLDLEYDVFRNTTLFADYQVGQLRGIGKFQNGSLGVRHRFDEHWNLDVSLHGSTYPKIEVGYHNKDLSIELMHWQRPLQMLERTVGSPGSVTQINASLKF